MHLKNGALNTYCIGLLEESSIGIHESAAGIFAPLSPTGLKGAGDLLRFPLDSLGTPKRQPQNELKNPKRFRAKGPTLETAVAIFQFLPLQSDRNSSLTNDFLRQVQVNF